MGDVECNKEKSIFAFAINNAIQLAEIINQKSDVLPKSSFGSMDSSDIDIISIIGSALDKDEETPLMLTLTRPLLHM